MDHRVVEPHTTPKPRENKAEVTELAWASFWARGVWLGVPVGSYHVPFYVYPILLLGIYNHKFGNLKKGTWYEPTGTTGFQHLRAS